MITRPLGILLCLFILQGSGSAQTKDATGYMQLKDSSETALLYTMGESSYLIHFLHEKAEFDGNLYHACHSLYSWGDKDTTYFREDENNYLHYDPQRKQESVSLPKIVELGQKWFEADSSWSYEIIGINEQLKTPAKKYKDLIVVRCVQETGRDSKKSLVYHQYYAKGIGLVGSMSNGKLSSYLSQVKMNPKQGDIIGK